MIGGLDILDYASRDSEAYREGYANGASYILAKMESYIEIYKEREESNAKYSENIEKEKAAIHAFNEILSLTGELKGELNEHTYY